MAAKRFHWHTRGDYRAECDDCPWASQARTAQGSAAQHHDRTGHTVRVEVTRVIVYEKYERYLAWKAKMDVERAEWRKLHPEG